MQMKSNKELVAEIQRMTQAEIGGAVDADTFRKALEKAKRWMRNAYGSADLEEWINENGGSIAAYYRECQKDPTGRDTFNRQTARK
jgi:hypothetical protein